MGLVRAAASGGCAAACAAPKGLRARLRLERLRRASPRATQILACAAAHPRCSVIGVARLGPAAAGQSAGSAGKNRQPRKQPCFPASFGLSLRRAWFTPRLQHRPCMHGASYISGVSCARTTWLGLISMLKIRLEPLVVLPRCEGEWCWCYPLRMRGNSNEIG